MELDGVLVEDAEALFLAGNFRRSLSLCNRVLVRDRLARGGEVVAASAAHDGGTTGGAADATTATTKAIAVELDEAPLRLSVDSSSGDRRLTVALTVIVGDDGEVEDADDGEVEDADDGGGDSHRRQNGTTSPPTAATAAVDRAGAVALQSWYEIARSLRSPPPPGRRDGDPRVQGHAHLLPFLNAYTREYHCRRPGRPGGGGGRRRPRGRSRDHRARSTRRRRERRSAADAPRAGRRIRSVPGDGRRRSPPRGGRDRLRDPAPGGAAGGGGGPPPRPPSRRRRGARPVPPGRRRPPRPAAAGGALPVRLRGGPSLLRVAGRRRPRPGAGSGSTTATVRAVPVLTPQWRWRRIRSSWIARRLMPPQPSPSCPSSTTAASLPVGRGRGFRVEHAWESRATPFVGWRRSPGHATTRLPPTRSMAGTGDRSWHGTPIKAGATVSGSALVVHSDSGTYITPLR